MSNDKIHWRDLSYSFEDRYVCNHAVRPREGFLTSDVNNVTCKNCRKVIDKYSEALINKMDEEIETNKVKDRIILNDAKKQIILIKRKQKDLALLLLFIAILGLLNLLFLLSSILGN